MTLLKNLGLLVLPWLCGVCGTMTNGTATPVVIWHGSGDTSEGIPKLIKFLVEENIPGIYVKRIHVGANLMNEFQNSLFMHPDIQVSRVCKQIKNDENLSDGYNAIGLSQGGIFLRAIAQRCPDPPMKNLITLASPHQGVYGLPKCQSMQTGACELIRYFLFLAAYKSSTQKLLVPATYWHDPFNEALYRWHSTFLADINNERGKNEKYSENLQKLEKFVMVKFRNDTVTQPRETHWFEFYIPGQDIAILPLRMSKLYFEDRLGLAQMEKNDQLVFLELDGEHLMFSKAWFRDNLIKYLS